MLTVVGFDVLMEDGAYVVLISARGGVVWQFGAPQKTRH